MRPDIRRFAEGISPAYRLEDVLGEGGMAVVYRARDLRHDRDVALKILRLELAGALGRERFLREIRLAARLSHPHILPLYDSGEVDGRLFFTMPLVEGETLRTRLAREGRLPVEDAIRLASEIADALDYAHRHDIVHRDIKPDNVLLHEGHAVVADFGIGRAMVAASEPTGAYTQVGLAVGTPAYMSPEQASGEALDGRTDLFALGCVLYEMLTGEVAFSGPTAQATIARRFVHSPPPVSSRRPDVPAAVTDVVSRLLEKSADARVQSGALVIAGLRGPQSAAHRTAGGAAQRDERRSIVVIPFVNLSPDPDSEYFSDGLTEEIITDLSHVSALRVISRTSSMHCKGTSKSLRELGDTLGVDYALTGTVRKAGPALRITAQLAEIRTDETCWAERFNGTLDDVFDVQERVARAIARALDVAVSPVENEQLAARPIRDVRAFELYLRARDALWAYDPARAAPLIARAIEIEGDVPVLRAQRAMSLMTQVRIGAGDAASLLAQVEREARALLALAPDQAEGHALLGFVGYERGDQVLAVRSLRRAMELDPSDGDVRFFHGIAHHAAGKADPRAAEWLTLDPLSPLANVLAGAITWLDGRASEGLAAMDQALRLAPGSLIVRWSVAYHDLLVGRIPTARAHADWLASAAPQLPYTIQLRSLVASLQGCAAEARSMLDTVDLTALDAHHTFHIAEAFSMAGDPTTGLRLLATAVERGFYPYPYYAWHCPFLAPVRNADEFHGIAAAAAARAAAFERAIEW